MSINAKFAALCRARESQTRSEIVAKIVNYVSSELSDKELRILAFDHSARALSRFELLMLVTEMLGKMTSGHLDQIAGAVPFAPVVSSAQKKARKPRRRQKAAKVPAKWAEHDEDCRPSTFGEVTEKQLDRELEDYFDANPRGVADESENLGEKEFAEINRVVSRVTLILSEYCAIQPCVRFYPLETTNPFDITHIRIVGTLVDPENPPIENDIKRTLENLWKSFSKVSVVVSGGTILCILKRT
jgi:hypothetical protein